MPRKTPPAKPATPASLPGTVKPGVVAQIGKRPPVVPPDPALVACFATPFQDTTAQDLELMVEPPAVAAKAKASPETQQSPDTSLAYLDLIVPDLEDHMSMSPALQVFPPVPTTPLSSESEERQGDLIRRRRAVCPRPAGSRNGDADRAGDFVNSHGGAGRLWCTWERALLPRQPPPRRLPPDPLPRP